MSRKSNPTVIIVNTGLATEESKSAMIEMLQDKVAHIHQDPDLDWKSALGYHDIEKSGIDADFIREGTEVILLQDNVVLHSNCKEILQQPIPEKGSAQPFISQGDARDQKIIVPANGEAISFEKIVGDFYEKINTNEHENQTLTELRDTLIPKLMSGEIRLKDAEREVESAV